MIVPDLKTCENVKVPKFAREEINAIRSALQQIALKANCMDDEVAACAAVHDEVGSILKSRKVNNATFKKRKGRLIMTMRECRADIRSKKYEEKWVELYDKDSSSCHNIAGIGETSRYVPVQGLSFKLKPEIDEATIYDSAAPSDCFCRFSFVAALHTYAMFIGTPLSAIAVLLSPVVWMDATGADTIFWNTTAFNTTTLLDSKHTMSPGLVSFATLIFIIWNIMVSFAWTGACLMVNRSMLQLQWETSKYRFILTIGINLVYTLSAGSLFPGFVHALYLWARTAGLIFVCLLDSNYAFNKLRYRPQIFFQLYGGNGKSGCLSKASSVLGLIYLLCDVFRHYVRIVFHFMILALQTLIFSSSCFL